MRALVIDDEQPALERLKKLLRPYSDIDVVGEAQDGLSALSLVEAKKPDVIFLDIDMPELSGLEVARTLGVEGPLIVFVTAYDEYALSAFESSAVDYLVKPVHPERLAFALEKIRKTLSPRRGSLQTTLSGFPYARLAIKIGARFEVFDPLKISHASVVDHYTSLYIEGRELLADDSLEALMQRLDPNLFIRVHRGAAINIKFLKELKREGDRKYLAILNDGRQIQVSRERLPILKARLGL